MPSGVFATAFLPVILLLKDSNNEWLRLPLPFWHKLPEPALPFFKIFDSVIQRIHPVQTLYGKAASGNAFRRAEISVHGPVDIHPPESLIINKVSSRFIFMDFPLGETDSIPKRSLIKLIPGYNKISGISVIGVIQIG